MRIHIIRNGEVLNDILQNYSISKDDLVSNNKHITDFDSLVAGMKLKIPFLNQETMQILESSEPFIKDYNPSLEKFLKDNEKEVLTEDSLEEVGEVEITESKPKVRGIRYVAPPNNPFYNRDIRFNRRR